MTNWAQLDRTVTQNADFFGPMMERILADVIRTLDVPHFARWPQTKIEAALQELWVMGELSLRQVIPKGMVACHRGCSFCCLSEHPHVTELELWPVVSATITSPRLVNAVKKAAKRRLRLPKKQRDFDNAPCPLLHGRECSIYSARPLQCRAWTSTSAWACEHDRSRVVYIGLVKVLYSSLQGFLMEACRRSKLQAAPGGLDFVLGLEAALKPGAFQRWQSGERLTRGSRFAARA